MKKQAIGIIIIILVIIAAIWGFNRKTAESKPSIKIGVIYGFTGPAATWADMGKKGIDLAVAEINQAGGVNGQNIEIIYEDSKTNPAEGVSAFNKLASVDHVSIIVGDVWSFLTNPLIPLAEKNQVILISPTVMDNAVEKTNPYFYTTGHTIESQRQAFNAFFDVNHEVKTISILCWNDAWGQANTNLLLDIANKRNIRVLSKDCTSDFSSTYQTEMAKIRAANPDAIFSGSSIPDVALRKIKDFGLGEKKVLTLSVAIDAIEVNKIPTTYLKNVYFTNWVANQEFVDKFKSKYGVFPIIEAQNHYDTIKAIALALEKGGDLNTALKKVKLTSVEGSRLDFTTGDSIRINQGQAGLYTYDGNYKKVITTTSTKTIKIGIITDLTGPAAYWGESTKAGVEILKKELAAKGTDVEFIIEDYGLNPAKAISATQKLTSIDKVSAIYVEFNPGAIAAASILKDKKMPLIYNAAITSPLTSSDLFYKTYLDYQQGCKQIAQKFKVEGIAKMGILKVNLEFGELCQKGIKEVYGNNIISEGYNLGDTDFRTQLLKIKTAGAGAVINVGFEGDTTNTLKAIRDNDYTLRYGTVDDTITADILKLHRRELKGAWTFGFTEPPLNFQNKLSGYKVSSPYGAALAYIHLQQLATAIAKCGGDVLCTKTSLNQSPEDQTTGFNKYDNRIADLTMKLKKY